MENDTIYRQAALDALSHMMDIDGFRDGYAVSRANVGSMLRSLPSAQPERLTDDDFETIRIHLNAYKEKLCNQNRWEEAEEYQRIIDRFMAFASAQSNTSNTLNALSAKMDETCPDVVIRRQDVVNVIFKEIDSCDKALLYMAPGTNEKKIIELQRAIICGFFRKIAQLPFAQPEELERKKGKWIFVESVYKNDGWDSDIYRCNQCHRRTELRVVLKRGEDITDYKRYCECCGADMRGEQDD